MCQCATPAGADVNIHGKDGTTALIEAARNGYDDCVQKLLDAGADVNARNASDNTSLIYAVARATQTVSKCLFKPEQL